MTLWTEEHCHRVHQATLRVLSEIGVEVRYQPALACLQRAGARVEGSRVQLEEGLVREALETAPKHWHVASRDPERAGLILDASHSYFGTGSDCLYVRDREDGRRRRARLADIEGMAALCESLSDIDFVMSMGLPEDVSQQIDDLAPVRAMLRGTRKPLMIAPRNGDVLEAVTEMAALCGASDSIMIYSMPSPPLIHDADALSKLMACAELRIPHVYAPAPAPGATGPASLAGSVVVGNAEVLSGLVVHQLVNPGAPFVYGAGASMLDLRTAIDAYAAPETSMGNQAACDLARWYGLPSFAYAGVSDSKLLDEQWAAEAALTVLLGALSRATLLHDVGYLESGLQSSFETIVLGNELVRYARRVMSDISVDDEALAVNEIIEVGPGGNHMARPYTRRHHREFWRSGLMDHMPWNRWESAGALTLGDRVRMMTDELCAAARPVVTPDIDEQLLSVLERVERTRA